LTNTQTSEPGSLDQVALGNPSFVWRSGQERRLEMIRRYVNLEGARVLDIGCGLGAYVRAFSRYTDQAYGLDIDAKRVETGVEEGLSRLVTGVSEALPFADGSFDGILLNEVLEHVRNDRETLREALRVLRPGGRIVIFVRSTSSGTSRWSTTCRTRCATSSCPTLAPTRRRASSA
jgi:ubiquinone/menaquinone biosynthesis C-methylase UbiE